MAEATLPDGKTPRAISDSTEAVELGRACILTARKETARNRLIAKPAMITSVCAAFFDCGRRKAETPFEIASTPVSAAEPDAKARRTRKTPTDPVPAASTCVLAACGAPPVATFQRPTPTIAYIAARKA